MRRRSVRIVLLSLAGGLCISLRAGAHHAREPAGFLERSRDADRLFDREKYAEAIQAMDRVLALARGAENIVHFRYRRALALRHLKRAKEAILALEKLAQDYPRADKSPRALFVAAEIRLDEAQVADGERALEKILFRYPDSHAATRALRRLVERRLGEDPGGSVALSYLRKVYRRFRRRGLADDALYLAAGLFEKNRNDPERAARLYRRLADRHPESGFADDALWKGAHLERALGRHEAAIRLLRRLVASRRDSWIMGSYNSIYVVEAQLLIGRIFLEDLKDPPRAAEELGLLEDYFPRSVLLKEALWLRAMAHRAARDEKATRATLDRLIARFPKSRRADAARAWLKKGAP